jgi:hypothetical protein
LPPIDWGFLDSRIPYDNDILELFSDFNLDQLVEGKKHLLDLVLTDCVDRICSVIVIPQTFSDHFPIIVSLIGPCPESVIYKTNFSFSRCDYDNLNIQLRQVYMPESDPCSFLDSFYDSVFSLSISYIPRKTNRRAAAPIYMSSHSIHLENKLNTAKRRGSPELAILAISCDLGNSLEMDKILFLRDNLSDLKSSYTFIQSLRKCSSLPRSICFGDNMVTGDYNLATAFNEMFVV